LLGNDLMIAGDHSPSAVLAPSYTVLRPPSPEEQDALLCQHIRALTNEDPELWSSPDRARGDSTHGFFQYPAMMVPKVQRRLAEVILEVQPDIRSVVDPFVGAGTALVSTMHRGVNCYGQDINPLAVLLARTRTGPVFVTDLSERVAAVVRMARADTSEKVEASFPNLQKWFRDDVSMALSRLRRAIRQEEDLWVRRFLWVTLAETIRLTSNDRTSTYKLHARPADEIAARKLAPIDTFAELAAENVEDLGTFTATVSRAGYLEGQRYRGEVRIALADTMRQILPIPVVGWPTYDLVITSPPYGDNTSTVPYGQHSYLPLQWIDLPDIDPEADATFLRTTQEIDRKALGGKRTSAKALPEEIRVLGTQSDSLARTFIALKEQPVDRPARVASFYRDFATALDRIVESVRSGAYLVWTVGNRTVGGVEIPNDQILSELLTGRDVVKVIEIERTIHFKRMPDRNDIAPTMSKERILIFRKRAGKS